MFKKSYYLGICYISCVCTSINKRARLRNVGMKKHLLCMGTFGCLFMSSCAVYDLNYDALPSLEIGADYSNPPQQDADAPAVVRGNWWDDFNRPELSAFIEQALQNNQDIAAAIARIEQARALHTQTRSGLLPQIDGTGNITDSRQGSDGQRGTGEAGAALSWEVDLFGRLSQAAKADELETVARAEDLNALKLSLSSDVANAYFGAVAANKTLQLLGQQLKTDQDLLDLIDLRLQNGIGTKVEVLQQQNQVTDSQSLIPPAKAQLRVFENRLDVLLGRSPDGKDRVSPAEDMAFSADIPAAGIPADLLLNRPDLRAAKADLIAADADIGAAIADRLPRLTLDGSYLYTDTAAFSGPVSMIMGSFVQPLLDWGARRATVKRNKAIYTERLADFTQLYLEAVEEVENALYQEQMQRDYIKRLHKRAAVLQETVDETEALYAQGVSDYLPVLNALQDLRAVERDLVTQRLNLITYRIDLYRALGGNLSADDTTKG